MRGTTTNPTKGNTFRSFCNQQGRVKLKYTGEISETWKCSICCKKGHCIFPYRTQRYFISQVKLYLTISWFQLSRICIGFHSKVLDPTHVALININKVNRLPLKSLLKVQLTQVQRKRKTNLYISTYVWVLMRRLKKNQHPYQTKEKRPPFTYNKLLQ